MAFIQFNLDKSINQSRGVFDKFIYSTDDDISTTSSEGYFSGSRFLGDSDWSGSVIECLCSDGYLIAYINGATITPLYNSSSGGMPVAPVGDYYVADGSTWSEITSAIKSDREIVVRGTDISNQNPSAVDAPMTVTWGTGSGVPSDPVYIESNGNINIVEAGNYHFRISLQYGRTGSGGTAWVWLRFLVNGFQAGVSVLAKLNNASSDFPYQAELTADLPAGVVVTGEIWRGSEGVDDGGLVTETPVLAGASASPSADMIISRYVIKES